jgi:eukaryotic-like serine/threonine-protein kinase
VGEHTLNDVLRIILETMYRAIGFERALLFTLDARQQALRCRFGFGADAEAIAHKNRCTLERAKGVEPSSPAWEAGVMPLYDARKRYES